MAIDLNYDPRDTLGHIGEALGMLLIAIASEHDNPSGLLDAMHRQIEKCDDHPNMFAPTTRALLLQAAKALEGVRDGIESGRFPN